MTLKAYYDNIQAKTGKTPQDFVALAEKKGYLKRGVKAGQIVDWLKNDYGLGRGHAMALVLAFQQAAGPKLTRDDRVGKLFRGARLRWRPPYEAMLGRLKKYGPDVSFSTTDSYISFLRKGRKFAIVQPTRERLDIGIKLKGVPPKDRFKASGSWNAMVTHRVQITDAKQTNEEVLSWLRRAYDQA